jgi:uncharacterized protein YjbI with pentapeptide repeats
MRVIKPQRLGILPKPYGFQGKYYLSVGTLLFFRLGQLDAQAHVLPEHEAWPSVCRELPPGVPLDFGMPKLRGEVLLAGAAHAPRGEPRQELSVRLQLGGIDKRLIVHGDRNWQFGLIPCYQHSAARAFTRMPLTFERAFGGPAFAENPLGVGHYPHEPSPFHGSNQGPLPNVEYPGDPVRAGSRSHRPASFLPLALDAPERKRKAGTYDQQWLQRDFPGYARDLDFSYFNAAPSDQWLPDSASGPARLCGGEAYRLEHLHPQQPVLCGRVPEVRARTFWRRDGEPCRELPSHADTVWFFPEADLGVLIFHAAAEVLDSEALDVRALMVAYELGESAPRPIEHYGEVMHLRCVDKTAALHAFDESQLCPPRARPCPELARDRQQAAARAALEDALEELREAGAPLPADFELPPPEPPAFPSLSEEEVESGDFDLTDMVAGAEATARALEEEGRRQLASVQAPPEAGAQPVDVAAEVLAAIARADGSARQNQLDALAAQAGPEQEPALAELGRQLQKLPALAPTPPPEAAVQAVGQALAEYVARVVRAGGSLRGADLTGAHLRDLDLSGHDLQGTGLAHTRLTRVRLDRARLAEASFAHAVLEEVSLRAADLRQADFSAAQLSRCCLAGALLDQSQWRKTHAQACDLSEAQVIGAQFVDAALERCSFRRARFQGGAWLQTRATQADFRELSATQFSLLECELEAADWSQSELHKLVFLTLRAPGARFEGAQLAGVLFSGGSALPGASFRGLRARDCGFRGTLLDGSDFTRAVLSRCDLSSAQLRRCRFDAALVSRSGLRQVQGQEASFAGADLYHSNVTKADWTRADFRHASLYRVEASGAIWEGAALAGAEPRPERRA